MRSLSVLALLVPIALLSATRCDPAGHWVAVVAPGLQEAVQPLADLRRGEGWEVTIIRTAADNAPARQQIAALAAKSQPCCVLLVGNFTDEGVPAGEGTKLRMAGEPTDLTWTQCAGGTPVEVGRLPARNPDEARIMVQKILRWQQEERPRMTSPSAVLLAGHHAAPEGFSTFADNLTNSLAQRLIARLPAEWRLDAAVHVDGSPWQVSGGDVRDAATRMMSTPATLFAFMGHSDPTAALSKETTMLAGPDWQRLSASSPRPALFLTCGCFGCQVSPQVESYGLAAIRAPGGPPAVIGSHGESWSAMGYLAMSGLTAALESRPVRVGEFWQATLRGIERAEINPTEFAMLDMADGTGGKVPLDQQRLEHMEMWMLLGDPAMPLVPAPSKLDLKALVEPGSLTVMADLPAAHAGTAFRVTIERHPAAVPDDLPAVPGSGSERQTATRERRRLAGDVVFAAAEIKADGAALMATIPIPADAPARPWTLRVASTGKEPVAGVIRIP